MTDTTTTTTPVDPGAQKIADEVATASQSPAVAEVEVLAKKYLPKPVRVGIYITGVVGGILATAALSIAGLMNGQPQLAVGDIGTVVLAVSNAIALSHIQD